MYLRTRVMIIESYVDVWHVGVRVRFGEDSEVCIDVVDAVAVRAGVPVCDGCQVDDMDFGGFKSCCRGIMVV